jgi:hypothetical protein
MQLELDLVRRVLRPSRGMVDKEFWRQFDSRRAARDSQRRRVYTWEQQILGSLQREPLLGQVPNQRMTQPAARKAALTYLTHLWTTYATRFQPYYAGIPYLRVGFAICRRGRRRPRTRHGAYAVPHRHEIYCQLTSLRRSTFVHEVCHLFAWGDGHGAAFCATLVRLWKHEFGIHPQTSLSLAERLRVAVDHSLLDELCLQG